ncbi:SNF2-related [Macleaya cordata]|uniref:SNF2-related n=1 Tax=Macleaya cordata TaxID=56857 RepID=A0A200PY36_MACCD|nr:SNF2-related [Macleaya cordata]OVA09288.1 SNF2-related [Macleaya cordata]
MEQNDPLTSSSTSSELVLVGFVTVNIVGLQHYFATIKGREMVGLIREPLNPHDQNAIKVVNIRNSQLGYIERSSAASLSPLIDNRLITIEGIALKTLGVKNRFKVPCQIHIFARIDDFPIVRSAIMESGLQLISGSNPAFTLSESAIVKELKPKKKSRSVDEIFKSVCSSENDKGRRWEALEPPKDIIKTELFMHQKEGLGWLVHRENSNELPPFWVEKDGGYENVLTDYHTNNRPNPLRGGIFADDMGLGKTLTLLSLIATNRPDNTSRDSVELLEAVGERLTVAGGKTSKKRKQSNKIVGSNKKLKRIDTSLGNGNLCSLEPKTTLIVCPPSVFSTWITQLDEHTTPGNLKVYMYYGTRTDDPEELQRYDVVLTTYGTLVAEHLNNRSPIKKIEWFRVVLDEAHVIKNVKSSQSEAVLALKAKRRWAVTGTPILNGAFDLYSLMVFLRFEPFSVKNYWQNLVQRPLDKGNGAGLSRLQDIMATISLRRLKDNSLVGLPPKSVETCFVELYAEEREKYDQMEMDSQNVVRNYIRHGSVVLKYSSVLSIILRLRQICNDAALCPSESLPSYIIEGNNQFSYTHF